MARLASWALAVALSAAAVAAQATSPGARWGQSSALVSSHFLVYGGKTGSGFTYTSGPNDASLFSLDLSQPFTTSSAPWQLVQPIADNNNNGTTTSPPAVAFGSLAPLTHRQVLIFGGDSTADAVQTSNDSVYTFQLVDSSSATWSQPQLSSQPMRRIGQSVESDGRGGVWVVGGQKDDGSNIDLVEAWSYNASSDGAQGFQSLPAPPASLVGATSTLLSDGSLLLLGGQDATGSLQSFSSVAAFDTTTKMWMMQNTTGSAMPTPRRNHIAVSLPSKRVFIHGGASDSALTTALSDAWILDWSVDPPVWSRVDDGTASGGPGARFGHSAVAVGRNIAMTCGWSGGNSAQEGVWVFDGTSLQSSGAGVWSGGSWTASYTPDGASSGSSSSQSGAKNAGGNGASTSSGGSSSSSGSKGGSGSSSGSSSSSPSSSKATPFQPTSSNSGSPTSNDDSTSPATKAGAAIGALVGCGLVVAGAYFLYQRHQDTKYRSVYAREAGFGGAGGAAGLLVGGAAMGGRDEEEAWAEKEMGAGGWYAASPMGPTRRPAGPRAMNDGHGDAWTAGNVPSSASHAREGSGPRMRQRLALLTGLTSWGHATNGQTRFDMLADEEERDPYSMREQAGDDMHDPFYDGARGSCDEDHDRDGFVSSPFEDREPPAVASSEQSHNTTTTGGTPNYTNSSHSSRSTGGPHTLTSFSDAAHARPHTLTSFSDAAHARPLSRGSSMLGNSSWLSPAPWGPGVSDASGSMMRRSPTWWSRFMGNLERSASGRTVVLPGAGEPIRDPAQPSMVAPDIGLSVIREVPRSADPSEDNGADPFADGAAAATAGAGAVDATALANANAGSQTSLGSSHLEAQLQGMDVIQRTRTGSSRRTQSTRSSVWTSGGSRKRGRGRPSEQGSVGAESSRMGSLSEEAVVRHEDEREETIDAEETPGEVVWGGPADWQGQPTPHLPHSTTSTAWLLSPHDEDPADGSMDIVSQLHDEPDTTATPYTYDAHTSRRAANVSDTPSLTPATTKRARANTELTSPVRKAAKRSPTNVYLSEFGAPGNRTVRDRVKLIEGVVGGGEKETEAPRKKMKSHGLAPRGQLFVANPDDE